MILGGEMKKESFSVFMACALGAFVGALSAMEIASAFAYGKYFWVLGALFGGVVAYIAADFKSIPAGVARAYRETIGFRPDFEGWKTLALTGAGVFTAACTIFGLAILVAAVFDAKLRSDLFSEGALAVATAALLITIVFIVLEATKMDTDGWYDAEASRGVSLFLLKHVNPISATYWMLCGAWYLLRRVPAFAKLTFVYVHSDLRTLCFVDAALGAGCGYLFGSAILGALVGGVLGVLNYELVSIRLLKLAPTMTDQSS
jgi:hypothetical protein